MKERGGMISGNTYIIKLNSVRVPGKPKDQAWGDARLEEEQQLILRFQKKMNEFFKF
jgi:hypothetical protein